MFRYFFFSIKAYTVDNKTNSHFHELIITDGTRNTEPVTVIRKRIYRMDARVKKKTENEKKIVQNW